MALTITNRALLNLGNRRAVMADLAFDSSYAFGGETLSLANLGMTKVERVVLEHQKGYHFEFDHDNEKIKVLAPAPPIVVEEQHTIASNAITLNYPPAYIMCVAQANANVAITDSGATLGGNDCQPTADFTEGVRGGLTFHSGLSGVVYVTYVTQAWKEVWDNLVQGETATTATHVAELANDAIAIQSIRAIGTTGSNASLMLDKDDTAATLEAEVDFTPAAANTSLTFLAGDAITSAVVSYIKKPASGFLLENWIEEEAMTAASNVCTPAYPVLLWGYAGQAVENGAVTNLLINIGGSCGTNEAHLNLFHPDSKLTQDAVTTGTACYVKGLPSQIPGLVPLEVRNGVDLSGLTGIKLTAIGY